MTSRAPANRLRTPDMWIILTLLVGSLALFGRSAGFDYVNYDDDQYAYENPQVLDGLTLAGVTWAFTTGHASNWHPLTWLSLMSDVTLFGAGPTGHHVVNVLLHAANGALLFLALVRLTGDRWCAAICAALFAWHPLRAESVAWIAERKDVLSGLFWMLTLVAYERYARAPTLGRYVLTTVMLVLGLLSKPMLVTLPCVLLLLDFWPVRRGFGATCSHPAVSTGRVILEKVPWFALAVAASVVTFLVQRAGRSVSGLSAIPLDERLGNAAVTVIVYLRQTLVPTGLAPFYPHPGSFPGGAVDWGLAGLSIAAIVAGCATAIVWRRRAPWVAVGWFWYLGTLVPVVGLVQVGEQAHADRYTYLTVIGATMTVVWSVRAATAHRPMLRRGVGIACAVMLTVFVILTHRQVGFWRDSLTLWRHGTSFVANSFVGHNNLGEALERAGDVDAAAEQFARTLAIRPDDAMALNNTGVILIRRGQTESAKQYLKRALQRDPYYAPSNIHLGNIYARQNRADDAILLYRQAIARRPDYVNAYHNLAITLAERGELKDAMELWDKATSLNPNDADVRHHHGVALLMSGRSTEGIEQLRRALALQPERTDTLTRLAWVLATHPQPALRKPEEALELATRAATRAERPSVDLLDALAAAQASTGRFVEAVQTIDRAISLARAVESTDQRRIDALTARRTLFLEGTPFVQ